MIVHPLGIILLGLAIVFLFGAGGIQYGLWGGPTYSRYGRGGLGLGGLLLIIIIILALNGYL